MERWYMDTLNVDLTGTSQGIIDLGEGRIQTVIPSYDLNTNAGYVVYLRPCKGNATETFSTASKYRIKKDAGSGADFGNQPDNDYLHIVSDDATDFMQTVTIYGVGHDLTTISKVSVKLNGTTAVNVYWNSPSGTTNYGNILAIEVDGDHAGTITVQEASADATIKALATGTNSYGIVTPDNTRGYAMPVYVLAEGASTKVVGIWGHTTTGGETGEQITLIDNSTAVYTKASFVDVTKILTGDLAAATVINVGTYGILLNHGIFPATDMGSDEQVLQLHGTIRYLQYAVYSGITLSTAGAADRLALALYG